jgi:hypothetical protein
VLLTAAIALAAYHLRQRTWRSSSGGSYAALPTTVACGVGGKQAHGIGNGDGGGGGGRHGRGRPAVGTVALTARAGRSSAAAPLAPEFSASPTAQDSPPGGESWGWGLPGGAAAHAPQEEAWRDSPQDFGGAQQPAGSILAQGGRGPISSRSGTATAALDWGRSADGWDDDDDGWGDGSDEEQQHAPLPVHGAGSRGSRAVADDDDAELAHAPLAASIAAAQSTAGTGPTRVQQQQQRRPLLAKPHSKAA